MARTDHSRLGVSSNIPTWDALFLPLLHGSTHRHNSVDQNDRRSPPSCKHLIDKPGPSLHFSSESVGDIHPMPRVRRIGSVLTFLHLHDPVETFTDAGKDFQPVFSIVSSPRDGLAPIPLEVTRYTAPTNASRNGLAMA